jgi:hypothetical protein
MAGIWFAVGRPGGRRSALWQLWIRGSAAHLQHWGTGGKNHRFSFLHRRTVCRWTELNMERPRRQKTTLEWTCDPIPPSGSGLGCLLMEVIFPTNHLSPSDTPACDAIRWIDPAPSHWAVRLEFILAHQPQPDSGNPLRLNPDRQVLFSAPVRNGLCISAASSVFDCGPVELRLPQRSSKPGLTLSDLHFPEQDGHAMGRPIRVVLVGDNVQPPDIWELGGHEAVRQDYASSLRTRV